MQPDTPRLHHSHYAPLRNTRSRESAFALGFLAAMAFLALALPGGAVAQHYCVENGGSYVCKMAEQYPPRYSPLYYRSLKPECTFPTPPVVPPYSGGAAYDVEGDAVAMIHDTQVCDRSAVICDPGSMTPVQAFKPTIFGPPGFEPTTMLRAAPPQGSSAGEAFLWTYGVSVQGQGCVAESQIDFGMEKDQPIVCPLGHTAGFPWTGVCIASWMSQMCPVGNPIDPGIGAKTFSETDFDNGGSLQLSRRYYSYGYNAPGAVIDDGKSHVLGPRWRTPYDSRLYFMPGSTLTRAALVNDNGTIKYFRTDGSEYPHYSGTPVESLVDNGNGTWTLTRGDDSREIYDAQGRLLSLWDKQHLGRTLAYGNDGRLQSVTDVRGRVLGFEHLSTVGSGRIVLMTTPSGEKYRYTFDGRGNLLDVTMPGGKQRVYSYDHPRYFGAITGIADENGDAYEAVTYDAEGRATSSWLAPGTQGDTIARHTVAYYANRAQVTDALGLQSDLYYSYNGNVLRLGSTSQPCASCGGNAQTRTYDANGYPDKNIDFKGYETDTDYNARGLETQRREGQFATNGQCPLGSTYFGSNYGSACTTGTCWANQPFAGGMSAAPLGYPGQYYSCTVPPSAASPLRTVQTIWHASLRQPVERKILDAQSQTETITRWQYDANGQVIARCDMDPSAAAYPCDGQIGPVAGAKVRRWTYEYCNTFDVAAPNSTCPIEGLLKSVNGPRKASDAGMNGVDDVTTYTYYPSDVLSGCSAMLDGPCHRKGDLWKVTNALGHATENLVYDRNGRVLRSKDANGTITDHTYHARGWLLSTRVRANANGNPSSNDAVTSMAYDDAGNVTRVTQPDGVYLDYVYDAAHRLTDVVDNLGNRIRYTLDAAGNRVKEQTYDASYNPASPGTGLKREMSRAYNQLGRLTQMLDAGGQPTRDSTTLDGNGYDANGNEVEVADGLGVRTKREYDPLNRLTTMLQDYLGSGSETANAKTTLTYDARNNVRTVTDPDTLPTSYTYDGLGEMIDLDSPDTGHTDYDYDLAGNRIGQTDNRGKTTTYTYDALNRMTAMTFSASEANVAFSYDERDAVTGCAASFSKGRMTRIVDASGTTTLCYDRRGNRIRKSHLAGGETLTVSYAYDKADRLASVTYPSGGTATYARDGAGRVVGLAWKENAGATPMSIINNATYYPFGPLSVLTFGSGRTLSKSYDANYQIDAIASSAVDGLVLDLTSDVMGNIIAASDALGAATPTKQYRYDNHYRLTRVDDGAGAMQEDYGYSKTGDRTFKQWAGLPAQAYAYLTGTHRLGSVGATNRSYDANGNTTNRGDGKTLTYNDRNRLASVQVGGTTYVNTYNGKGERVSKFSTTVFTSTAATRYVYGEAGSILTTKAPGSSPFVEILYVDSLPVAQVSGASVQYLETDHLGTPRVAADAVTGAWRWRWSFFGSAFGEHQPTSAPVAGTNVSLRYPGQIADDPFDITYNYFRDYDATTGRYLESDPMGLSGGLSTFGYAGQSPYQFMDPYGLFCLPNFDQVTPWTTIRRQRNLSPSGTVLVGFFSVSCKWPDAWHVWQERQRRTTALCRECLPTDMNCPKAGETCGWVWKYGMWNKETRDFDEAVFTDGFTYSSPNLRRCAACRSPFGRDLISTCDTAVYGDDTAIKKN